MQLEKKLLRTAQLAVLAQFALSFGCQAGWLDTPDLLQLQGVGDQLRINGVPMEVRGFSTSLPVEDLLLQVQANWQMNNKNSVLRSKAASWTVLNQTVGDEHRSFQARDLGAGKTDGFVALTSPKKASDPKPAVSLPADLVPVSIIDSRDQGKVSQQVIAVSTRSIDATANSLEAALKAGGWQRHVRQKKDSTLIFSANKGDLEFDARLQSQSSGTLVMMNTIIQAR